MNDERETAAPGEEQIGDANREGGINSPKDTLGGREETKEPQVHNPRDFDNALYAALTTRAHSDQARALVNTVTRLVAERELAAGTRTNRRNKKETALRAAVEGLVADLLQAQASERTKGYVFRAVRPQGFFGWRCRLSGVPSVERCVARPWTD
jgi:hypothetical protein